MHLLYSYWISYDRCFLNAWEIHVLKLSFQNLCNQTPSAYTHLQRGGAFILGARQHAVKSIPGCNKWGCSRTCNEAGCLSWARASVQWKVSQVATNEDADALATRQGVFLGRAPAYSEKYSRLQQTRMQWHLQRSGVFILGARQSTVRSILGCNK